MKIVTVRRISQIFFLLLFLWLCVVSTIGHSIWQIRGWPVNLFLQMGPLAAVGTLLSTHTFYAALLPSLVIIIGTIFLGRFFCGWICPFGTMHHAVSHGAHGKKSAAEKIKLNRYRKGQNIKYLILLLFLVCALFPFGGASLLSGILDPLSLVTRSINLALLPAADAVSGAVPGTPRLYEGAFIIFLVFTVSLLMNMVIPRFYCRFVCPLGGLLGILGRFAVFRIGQKDVKCHECRACEKACAGGCEPGKVIHHSECLLCVNCLSDCPHETMGYNNEKSSAGEITGPVLSRKAFIATAGAGLFTVPALRLSGETGPKWDHKRIRPPGSAKEEDFLQRCIKCGQCMRVCPTNILHPGSLSSGVENLWTPVCNFRAGSSGCQYNCVACGQVCPTAAIRPITLEEKHGAGKHKEEGPVKIGTAFIDRSRCLPWAMGIPCIVCEENCPVSPKAIHTAEYFEAVRGGAMKIREAKKEIITVEKGKMEPGRFSTGDYYMSTNNGRHKIRNNGVDTIELYKNFPEMKKSDTFSIEVRLQRPYIDIGKCIGCGICEHECPVSGKKAVRVTAEGETREREHDMLLKKA